MLKTNDNPALTLDANGKVYLYGSHLSCGCVPRFTVRLDRRVDGAALEKAAGETLGRFPQMAVGLAWDKSNYFYIPIDLPVPVFPGDGTTVRAMGTDDTNGYLFCITYKDDTIHADWFHSLADGIGFLAFLKSLLYHYFRILGLSVEADGIRTSDTEFEAEEAEDAVMKIDLADGNGYPRVPAFRVPGVTTQGDPEDTVVQIRLPFSKFHGIVKDYQASPVTFICPLFSSAVREKHCTAEEERPVIASVPVNLRPYFPSKTTRCFIAGAGIPYDQKMANLSFGDILDIEKGLLDFQTQAHELARDAKRTAVETLQLLDADLPIEEKCSLVRASIEQTSKQTTYVITNMGRVDLPFSLEQHVKELYPCLPTAVNPFTLALVSYRGELVLNVAQRSPDTGVCERFVELLNGFDIPAEISKVYSFHTMRYGE